MPSSLPPGASTHLQLRDQPEILSTVGTDPYTGTPLYPVPYPVLAPIYWGALISSAAFGILCGQLYRYAKLGSWDLDARWLRHVVGLLAFIEMAYLVCASQGSWSVLVTDWMEDARTIVLPWGLKSATLFGAVSALIVHLWFARSAYRLVKSSWRWPLCALILILTLGQLAASITLFTQSLSRTLGHITTQGFTCVVTHLSFAAAADLAVVLTFSTLLFRQHLAAAAAKPEGEGGGLPSTSGATDKRADATNLALLRLLLCASTLLFLSQLITLAVLRARSRNTAQLFLQMVLPRLHSNVMLMCLNSPRTWRHDSQVSALRSGGGVGGGVGSGSGGMELMSAGAGLGNGVVAGGKGKERTRAEEERDRDFGMIHTPPSSRSASMRRSGSNSNSNAWLEHSLRGTGGNNNRPAGNANERRRASTSSLPAPAPAHGKGGEGRRTSLLALFARNNARPSTAGSMRSSSPSTSFPPRAPALEPATMNAAPPHPQRPRPARTRSSGPTRYAPSALWDRKLSIPEAHEWVAGAENGGGSGGIGSCSSSPAEAEAEVYGAVPMDEDVDEIIDEEEAARRRRVRSKVDVESGGDSSDWGRWGKGKEVEREWDGDRETASPFRADYAVR